MTKTAQVREYFREMRQSTPAACAHALGIPADTVRRCVETLHNKGWLKRVGETRGLYAFSQLAPHKHGRPFTLQKKLWRAVRMSRSFTAWEIAQLSEATLDYAKKYISFLRRSGLVEKVGRSGQKAVYRATGDAPGTVPVMRAGKPKKELARQDLLDLGWAMMRAIRDSDMDQARDLHGQIGEKLQTV